MIDSRGTAPTHAQDERSEGIAEDREPVEPPAERVVRTVSEVGAEVAGLAWAHAARLELIETARRYRSVTTYKDLSARVQQQTGIETRQVLQHWVGDVLLRVARDCAVRGEPNLASLCVNAAGSVGEKYRPTASGLTGTAPEASDDHAAEARLECYRYFGAPDLPADGGIPALTVKLAATRSRNRRNAHEARVIRTCPTCHLAVPATGVCDTCG